MTTQKTNAPLAGLVVLDLTHMLSGPYGTMTLSDLGARTIKVEPPGKARAHASCWRARRRTHAMAWVRTS